MSMDKQLTAEKWFSEYFTKGNKEVLERLTAPGFVYHARNGDRGLEKLKEFIDWFRSVFSDDEWVLDDVIEQGDRLVVRYTGWMTYKGGWFDVPAENQRIRETGIIIFRFEDGKVKEMWCENSDAAILYELGALGKNTHNVF
ncbi:ester cyclase [Indiicoccus explosivorum]|uniref:ester cyclase n=1 Tax=Indiicoccus explosivorum TaxID=1917864 RepID=UPI000B45408D|nr:ester cyclase [Indiicoccus explosivorum]